MSSNTSGKPLNAKNKKDTKIKQLIKSGGRSNALSDFNYVLEKAAKKAAKGSK